MRYQSHLHHIVLLYGNLRLNLRGGGLGRDSDCSQETVSPLSQLSLSQFVCHLGQNCAFMMRGGMVIYMSCIRSDNGGCCCVTLALFCGPTCGSFDALCTFPGFVEAEI